MGRTGCPTRVLKKIYKSWEDLQDRGVIRHQSKFLKDDEFVEIIINAEEQFGLTEQDQNHELFWSDCKNLLGDEISNRIDERRMKKPVWGRML